jgi:ubiquinone/menaquinone biosynthesis C-methylase UbiE
MTGIWTRAAGGRFLDWVSPRDGLAWLDIGCGTGAFTELLSERCAPLALHGIDPSDAQLGSPSSARLAALRNLRGQTL